MLNFNVSGDVCRPCIALDNIPIIVGQEVRAERAVPFSQFFAQRPIWWLLARSFTRGRDRMVALFIHIMKRGPIYDFY